jgi:hypothetical protein
MPLAPIRGAPPGASSPDFPIEEPTAKLAQPTAAPVGSDQPPISPVRQRQTPIDIRCSGITLTFRVLPELPAISRASMTIHVVADPVGPSSSQTIGYLRISAANARAFLADLRNGRSPTVATGDEYGTVQIEYKTTEAGPAFLVRKPDQPHVVHRSIIDWSFDMKAVADELLTDLGA